jgi:methyl-accepting chemotaxis protein
MEIKENKKFYSQKAITITTFFGGPIAAGILIRQNYLNIDKVKQGKNALFLGIASTILIFTGIFVLPENILDKIPNSLIPTIYTGIIYLIVEKIQGKVLKTHKENGGEFYSAWKAAKIGVLSTIAILFTVASIAFISGDISMIEPNFDSEAYNRGISTFVENEEYSIKVLQSFEIEDLNLSYLKSTVNKSVVLWKENKRIIEKISKIENLPDKLSELDGKLLKYCNLRIEQFELISKALNENTDRYIDQIQKVENKIGKILEELK